MHCCLMTQAVDHVVPAAGTLELARVGSMFAGRTASSLQKVIPHCRVDIDGKVELTRLICGASFLLNVQVERGHRVSWRVPPLTG